MDQLTVEPATRAGAVFPSGAIKHEVRYLRFVVNGRFLEDLLDIAGVLGVDEPDFVTPLVYGLSAPWYSASATMLAGTGHGELPSGRVPLLVCPECGDIGCGAIGAFIEVAPTTVLWTGFAYENNYDPSATTACEVFALQFDRGSYERLLDEAFQELLAPKRPSVGT